MPDNYHLPGVGSHGASAAGLFQLYLRFRDTRTLLWFLGFLFACFPHAAVLQPGMVEFHRHHRPSLDRRRRTNLHPHQFRSLPRLARSPGFPHRPRPYPLCHPLYHPARRLRLSHLWSSMAAIPRAACLSLSFRPLAHSLSLQDARGALLSKRPCPGAFPSRFASFSAAPVYGFASGSGEHGPLSLLSVPSMPRTAILVFYVFRRLSPGTFLAGLGFLAWSLNISRNSPVPPHGEPYLGHSHHRHGQGRRRHRHDPSRP